MHGCYFKIYITAREFSPLRRRDFTLYLITYCLERGFSKRNFPTLQMIYGTH